MSTLLDTHCHVDLAEKRIEIQKTISCDKVYVVGVTNLPKLFEKNKVIISETKYLKHALGYHPELISSYPNQMDIFRKNIHRTRYIGEIGIDGSKKHFNSMSLQINIFKQIVTLCDEAQNKILTIHSRKAEKNVLDILSDSFSGKVIMHWFTGRNEETQIAINRGYFFSINKKMLANNKGKELVARLPLNQILLESDYPFACKAGTEYSTQLLNETLNAISQLKGLPLKEMEKIISANSRRLLI